MVQVRPPEELSSPVQCETNPTGLNGVVVYGDLPSATTSPQDETSTVDNSAGMDGGLEQQGSSEENLVFPSCGHLTSGGRSDAHCPICLRDTMLRVSANRWSRNGRRAVIFLVAVIILLLIELIIYQ